MGMPPTVAPATAAQLKDNIGDVRMLKDGTLVCRYRAEFHDKNGKLIAFGEGHIIYKPDDPYYKTVLAFMGGMKPGDVKPMPRTGPLEQPPEDTPAQPKQPAAK